MNLPTILAACMVAWLAIGFLAGILFGRVVRYRDSGLERYDIDDVGSVEPLDSRPRPEDTER